MRDIQAVQDEHCRRAYDQCGHKKLVQFFYKPAAQFGDILAYIEEKRDRCKIETEVFQKGYRVQRDGKYLNGLVIAYRPETHAECKQGYAEQPDKFCGKCQGKHRDADGGKPENNEKSAEKERDAVFRHKGAVDIFPFIDPYGVEFGKHFVFGGIKTDLDCFSCIVIREIDKLEAAADAFVL